MLPEVVFLAELVDALSRDVHVVEPDVIGFVIAFVNGRIESLGIEADPLGQKLPCPRNRFFLEIVAEREVSEHLEESAVTRCFAYIFKVACADALLAGGHTPPRRDLLACEIGVDDQKALVIVGDQGETVHSQVSLALKELQEHFAKFVYAIVLHFYRILQNTDQKSNLSANHASSSAIGTRTCSMLSLMRMVTDLSVSESKS